MRAPQWTQGEWHPLFTSQGVHVCVHRPDGGRATVALIVDHRFTPGDSAERRLADAHLIAAAPALYEACEWLLDRAQTPAPSNNEGWARLESARAALAAARGEE